MDRKKWIFIIGLLLLVGIGIYLYIKNSNSNNSNYETTRVSGGNIDNNNNNNISQQNLNTQTEDTVENNDEENTNNTIELTQNASATTPPPPPKEEEIASFSTAIYSKDSARQKNMEITCNTLNGTIVQNGSSFSFCSTVGQATSAKGYQKADIFDKNGTKRKGLGGGNCQISTTLYNAILKIPSLVVTERHKHSNKVPYIKNGNDAAVAYGSYDLKFRNDSGNNIKITTAIDKSYVTVKLLKLI